MKDHSKERLDSVNNRKKSNKSCIYSEVPQINQRNQIKLIYQIPHHLQHSYLLPNNHTQRKHVKYCPERQTIILPQKHV